MFFCTLFWLQQFISLVSEFIIKLKTRFIQNWKQNHRNVVIAGCEIRLRAGSRWEFTRCGSASPTRIPLDANELNVLGIAAETRWMELTISRSMGEFGCLPFGFIDCFCLSENHVSQSAEWLSSVIEPKRRGNNVLRLLSKPATQKSQIEQFINSGIVKWE